MKPTNTLIVSVALACFLFIADEAMAQPTTFEYQGVARDGSGAPIASTAIDIRFGILEFGNSLASYTEDHTVTTSPYGLFTAEIGTGIADQNSDPFNSLEWGQKNYRLAIWLFDPGLSNWDYLGESDILAVPVALTAVNNWSLHGNVSSDTNFIGTVNDAPLSFRVNDQVSGGIDFDSSNTSFGYRTLSSYLSGVYNTSLGDVALVNFRNGDRNVALGYYASVGGSHNSFSGSRNAVVGASATSHGNRGVVVGSSARTWADSSVAIGAFAQAGQNSVVIGDDSGDFGGTRNVAIGAKSHQNPINSHHNVTVGYRAFTDSEQDYHNVVIGSECLSAGAGGGTLWGNVAIGRSAFEHADHADNNVIIGYETGRDITDGSNNVVIGSEAMENSGPSASSNVAIGIRSMWFASSSNNLVAIGDSALMLNGSNVALPGNFNTAIGSKALMENRDGNANTGNGYNVLMVNQNGDYNTAMGYQALQTTTDNYCTAIGARALRINTTGTSNVAVGYRSMNSNGEGDFNVAVGQDALYYNTTGDQRTAVGHSANSAGADYTRSTGLGYNADCTAGYQTRIGGPQISSIGGYANWTNISDRRFKKNIKENVPGLDFIQKLRPVTYNLDVHAVDDFFAQEYGERDSTLIEGVVEKELFVQSGFVAQDVERAANETGFEFSGVDAPKNSRDFYGLRYAEFVVPLVKAVQEQQEMIELLWAEIEELKKGSVAARGEGNVR